jgi:hypothetical protein
MKEDETADMASREREKEKEIDLVDLKPTSE